VPVSYAWRRPAANAPMGQALRWWLDRLEHPHTRHALLDRHDVG
jgi:hypothetical protein